MPHKTLHTGSVLSLNATVIALKAINHRISNHELSQAYSISFFLSSRYWILVLQGIHLEIQFT